MRQISSLFPLGVLPAGLPVPVLLFGLLRGGRPGHGRILLRPGRPQGESAIDKIICYLLTHPTISPHGKK